MGSVRRRGERIRVSLEAAEVSLLLHLSAQVTDLLADPPAAGGDETDPIAELLEVSIEPVPAPTDPILRRLLPDAYRDDDAAAGEFRRLTDADLRATKRSGLSRITSDLSAANVARRGGAVRLDLDEDAAAAWLPALTDIRLAIGTRIDVTEDMDEERMTLPVDSQRYAEIATYDWLSWLQEAMVRALMRD